MPPNEI